MKHTKVDLPNPFSKFFYIGNNEYDRYLAKYVTEIEGDIVIKYLRKDYDGSIEIKKKIISREEYENRKPLSKLQVESFVDSLVFGIDVDIRKLKDKLNILKENKKKIYEFAELDYKTNGNVLIIFTQNNRAGTMVNFIIEEQNNLKNTIENLEYKGYNILFVFDKDFNLINI